MIYQHPQDNLLTPLTASIATGAAASGYGVDRLANGDPNYPFKCTGVNLRLVWDLGSAVAIEGLYLFHHTIGGGTSRVQAHTADSWSSPDFSQTFTPAAVGLDGFFPATFVDLRSVFTSAKQYVSLDVASNTENVILGEVVLVTALRALPTYNSFEGKGVSTLQGGDTLAIRTFGGATLTTAVGNRVGGFSSGSILADRTVGEAQVQAWAQSARWRARPFPVVFEDSTAIASWVRFAQDAIESKYLGSKLVRIPVAFEHEALALPWVSAA